MPIEVVRSEEELRTGVRRRAYERVVMRTKVVTEEVTVTVTVPIRRQVLEIQRIPIHDEAERGATSDLGPDVVEVVLSEERPVVDVVDVRVVPVERVRVVREARQVAAPVTARVAHEEVDVVSQVVPGEVGPPTAPPAGGARTDGL